MGNDNSFSTSVFIKLYFATYHKIRAKPRLDLTSRSRSISLQILASSLDLGPVRLSFKTSTVLLDVCECENEDGDEREEDEVDGLPGAADALANVDAVTILSEKSIMETTKWVSIERGTLYEL